jgi:hypothetical protein
MKALSMSTLPLLVRKYTEIKATHSGIIREFVEIIFVYKAEALMAGG